MIQSESFKNDYDGIEWMEYIHRYDMDKIIFFDSIIKINPIKRIQLGVPKALHEEGA